MTLRLAGLRVGQEVTIRTQFGDLADVVLIDVSDWRNGRLYVEHQNGDCEWIDTDQLVRV